MSAAYLAGGVLLVFGALILALFVVFRPRYLDIAVERRRPNGTGKTSLVASLSGRTVAVVEKGVGDQGRGPFKRGALADAGLKVPAADFTVLVLCGAFVAGLLGFVLRGLPLAVLFAVAAPVLAWVLLKVLADKRRAKFDLQLGDTLMTLSGGLRAGHSIMRTIDGASQEAEAPMSEELSRILNETRVGRDLEPAIADVAKRMKSEDFSWIGQAIQINREVGGDLAEVLDHVGETIRERSQIKGQVKALAAEGKFSAYILVALPFFIALVVGLLNPGYLGVLTGSVLGWVLITFGLIMMAIGSFWMSRIIKIKF